MKKIILALCSAILIFACNMLTPATVCAGENGCSHVYSASYEGYHHSYYTHQYVIQNGQNQPVYGTCTVDTLYYGCYPRCIHCGNIDYANYYWQNTISITHSSCGQ